MGKDELVGEFIQDRVLVQDLANVSRLLQRNYGFKEKNYLVLDLHEALTLQEISNLKIMKKDKLLSRDDVLLLGSKKEKEFYLKNLVFNELRIKGHVVKTGLKFGFDFRVYPRGKSMDESHSEFVVQVLPENLALKITDLARMVRMAQTLNTRLVLAIVDNENNISYFKSERLVF